VCSNPVHGDATLSNKVCQWLATGRWFSSCTLVSTINKTDSYDVAEILWKVVLSTITLTLQAIIIQYSVLYDNDVRPFICEGWHCTDLWKIFAWPHYFTKRVGLGPWDFYWSACGKQESEQACIRGIDVACFYDFPIVFWNCSDSVVFPCFILFCCFKQKQLHNFTCVSNCDLPDQLDDDEY